MLLVDDRQMGALERAALRRFEDVMVDHSRVFSPRLSEILGPEQLRVAVRSTMQRATRYGFTRRGPIRLYVELALLRGTGFDTDPQYSALGKILLTRADEMERAERMHAAALEYRAKVYVPGGPTVYKALRDLMAFARAPVAVSSSAIDNMLYEMNRVFPRKVAFVGEPALRALIREAITECRRHRLSTFREAALIIALMFTLGHDCTADPLYPWIEQTLLDREFRDPAARAQRLEKSAETWLVQVAGERHEAALA
jgi:hypothetical protein